MSAANHVFQIYLGRKYNHFYHATQIWLEILYLYKMHYLFEEPHFDTDNMVLPDWSIGEYSKSQEFNGVVFGTKTFFNTLFTSMLSSGPLLFRITMKSLTNA